MASTDPYKATNVDEEASLKTKVDDLAHFMTKSKFAMMTTREPTGSLVSRCMAVAATESKGIDLLFYTNTQSHKTEELANDPHVNISFLNPSGEWASVSGTATVVTDRDLVKKHYNPTLKAWLGDLGDGKHDGSENDPRIGVIRVKMTTATYSLSHKSMLSRAAEVVHGAVTGQPAHVAKIREISTTEVDTWRTSVQPGGVKE